MSNSTRWISTVLALFDLLVQLGTGNEPQSLESFVRKVILDLGVVLAACFATTLATQVIPQAHICLLECRHIVAFGLGKQRLVHALASFVSLYWEESVRRRGCGHS